MIQSLIWLRTFARYSRVLLHHQSEKKWHMHYLSHQSLSKETCWIEYMIRRAFDRCRDSFHQPAISASCWVWALETLAQSCEQYRRLSYFETHMNFIKNFVEQNFVNSVGSHEFCICQCGNSFAPVHPGAFFVWILCFLDRGTLGPVCSSSDVIIYTPNNNKSWATLRL